MAYYGTSETYTANSMTVKVKIYLKMYTANYSVTTSYNWVQQVYYLEEGKNIDITIDENTTIGTKEP